AQHSNGHDGSDREQRFEERLHQIPPKKELSVECIHGVPVVIETALPAPAESRGFFYSCCPLNTSKWFDVKNNLPRGPHPAPRSAKPLRLYLIYLVHVEIVKSRRVKRRTRSVCRAVM